MLFVNTIFFQVVTASPPRLLTQRTEMATAPAKAYPLNGCAASYTGLSLSPINAVPALVTAALPECGAIIRNGISLARNGFTQNGTD